MTTMIVEVYEALRAIDVPDDKAKAAARALSADMTGEVATLRAEVAAFRKETVAEFAAVRGEMATMRKETAAEFAAVRGEMAREFAAVRKDIEALRAEFAVMRWMGATVLAILTAIALKIFLA